MRLSRFQHRESNNGKIVRAEIMKSRVFPDDTGTENLKLKMIRNVGKNGELWIFLQ